ncbi:hypothetical protein MKW94_003727 [Papaver nudicaule]|uniref:Uncharacterized protein n=1 Tax=Papaver nudicaule TaxID=74823 RepID=A0AA41SLR1_PAPNU|nr:hypothetical protein [Papaver nudicaule]
MDTDVSSSCSSNSNSLIVDNNDFIDMRVVSSSSTKGTKSTAKEFQGVVRILLVDYDLVFLHVMLRMFKMFNYYEAVGVRGGSAGLKLIREKPCYFDLVMTAVYMPGMSGHELFRRIKEEFTTLPVILVSSDVDSIKASKGMSNVVGHFLHKPITCSDVEKMWQYVHKSKVDHVVNENRYNKQTGSSVEQDSPHNQEKNRNISGSTSSDDEGNSRVESRKRKESQKGQPSDNKRNRTRTNKTQRVVWTERLHTHFLNAIESLGVDYAVPKKILEFMKVPGLTRENVASHLQVLLPTYTFHFGN